MLEEIKIRASRIVECDYLAVDNGVFWKVEQSIEYISILPVERLPPSRLQAQFAVRVNRERPIPVQLNLVHPTWSGWQFRDGKTFHRLDEASISAGLRAQAPHWEIAISQNPCHEV